MGIAAIVRPSPAVGEAFTLLTAGPGSDVAPYHQRQIVLLNPSDWAGWLDDSISSNELLRPSPAGFLAVERA